MIDDSNLEIDQNLGFEEDKDVKVDLKRPFPFKTDDDIKTEFEIDSKMLCDKKDPDKEALINFIKEEIKPNLKEEKCLKGELKPKKEENLKSLLKQESKSLLKQESKSLLKQDSKSLLKQESKSSLKQESKSLLKQESKSLLKQELKPTVKQNFVSLLKPELKGKIKGEFKPELKPNVKNESLKSLLKQESKSLLKQENKTSLFKQELKPDMKKINLHDSNVKHEDKKSLFKEENMSDVLIQDIKPVKENEEEKLFMDKKILGGKKGRNNSGREKEKIKKIHECCFCDYSASFFGSMTRHIKNNHPSIQSLHCKYCDFTCSRLEYGALFKHMRNH